MAGCCLSPRGDESDDRAPISDGEVYEYLGSKVKMDHRLSPRLGGIGTDLQSTKYNYQHSIAFYKNF